MSRHTTRDEMCAWDCKGIQGYALVLVTGDRELEFRSEVLKRDLVDCVDPQAHRCGYFFASQNLQSPRVDRLLVLYDTYGWNDEVTGVV